MYISYRIACFLFESKERSLVVSTATTALRAIQRWRVVIYLNSPLPVKLQSPRLRAAQSLCRSIYSSSGRQCTMTTSIDSLKESITSLGTQIRTIKQGGASSSSGGDLESITAELKKLKVELAKAEKEQKEELERGKITLKVPKVSQPS